MFLVKVVKWVYKYIMSLNFLYWKGRNKLYFKLKNVKYGNNLQVYNKAYLQMKKGHLSIGKNFTLTSGDCINPLCRNLRACIFITNGGSIVIGDNVGMSSPCLRISNSLTIGNNVCLGGNCTIYDSDAHPIDYMARRDGNKKDIKSAPVIIEDDAWLGANVIVLKGVTIGARSIIGAGSVVTKSIPPDCIAAGNPARVIKRMQEEPISTN